MNKNQTTVNSPNPPETSSGPRGKGNENCFGEIFEITSKIMLSKTKSRQTGTKHIIKKIRKYMSFALKN